MRICFRYFYVVIVLLGGIWTGFAQLNNEGVMPRAHAFKLNDVRLLESPFSRARDLDAEVLLKIKPDRLLHNFRENAGLKPRGEKYGGWEKMGIAGHSLDITSAHSRSIAVRPEISASSTVSITLSTSSKSAKSPTAMVISPVSLMAGLFGTDNFPPEGPYGKEGGDDWKDLPLPKIPKLVRVDRPLTEWIKAAPGKSLTFQLVGAGGESVTLVPLFRSQHHRMTVYRDAL